MYSVMLEGGSGKTVLSWTKASKISVYALLKTAAVQVELRKHKNQKKREKRQDEVKKIL